MSFYNRNYGELQIPKIKKINRNPVNGQFLKGHTPHNKGKKLSDYLTEEQVKEIMERFNSFPRKGNKKLYKYRCKPVVAIKDGKLCGVFESISEGCRRVGLASTSNICKALKGQRNYAGGYQWFYENDNSWVELIEQTK